MVCAFLVVLNFVEKTVKTEDPQSLKARQEAAEQKYGTTLPIPVNVDLAMPAISETQLNKQEILNATIKPARMIKPPKGTITFKEDDKVICDNVPLDNLAHAACSHVHTLAGSYTLTALYNGDDIYYQSAAASVFIDVVRLPIDMTLMISPAKDFVEENDKLTLTLQVAQGDSAKKPQGTVNFFINTMPISECLNKKVTESCSYVVKKNDGILEFTVKYSGDETYQNQIVQKKLQRKNGLTFEWITPSVFQKTNSPTNDIALMYDMNTTKNGLTFNIGISGDFNDKNIMTMAHDLQLSINAINVIENYLLETKETDVNKQEFENVKCSLSSQQNQNKLIATCKGFYPIVRHFNMTLTLKDKSNGLIGSQTFPILIVPAAIAQTQMTNQTAPRLGCGLNGTTRQRMFDCALKISNFGGYVDAKQNFVPYKPGSASTNRMWFLVSCPERAQSSQNCSWLSPILQPDNPALSEGEFDSNGIAMSQYANHRLLWSGATVREYNFFQANEADATHLKFFNYDEYPYVGESIMPKRTTATKKIARNICRTGSGGNLFDSKSPYNWQMPSYPMLLTLTGGNYCDKGGVGYEQNWKAICNGGSDARGFRAILIPGLVRNYLLSSSVDPVNNIIWVFNGENGNMNVDTLDDTFSVRVRCVSASW